MLVPLMMCWIFVYWVRVSGKAAVLISCWGVSKFFDLNNTAFLDAGWGTNEALIISILAHRNAAQRKLIQETYNQSYGEDLLKALDKELSSDFEVSFCLFDCLNSSAFNRWSMLFLYFDECSKFFNHLLPLYPLYKCSPWEEKQIGKCSFVFLVCDILWGPSLIVELGFCFHQIEGSTAMDTGPCRAGCVFGK